METLALTELLAALKDAGFGANTILLIVGGWFAVKYFRGNGFAKASDVKGLGASLDRMREASERQQEDSVKARAELHARIDDVVKSQSELRERVAVLDDRSRTGRCASEK